MFARRLSCAAVALLIGLPRPGSPAGRPELELGAETRFSSTSSASIAGRLELSG